MSQLAAHNLAMSNFYGTHQGGLNASQKGEEQPVQGVIRYVSMIVGLLSLFTIIALNVTNIIYMTESGGTMQSIKNAQGSIDGSMKDLSGTIMEDIKPKTDLINSMVSYNIPAQLSMIHQIIKNDVLKQCTPSFMFNNTICPLAENPTHSRYFEEVNLDSISECAGDGMHLTLGANPDYIEFPSFAPGSTRPGSCVRLPSFSLSSSVFAYTHTIMGHGCSELDVGDHYFAVGRIADAGHEVPQFETISSWFINDKINRRSCTVAAGAMDAWMGCVIMTETFYDDLDSLDTGKVTISYLDVFGRKKEWIYTRSEIQYDYTYTSAYFSIGSGVVVGDTVYFLIWGSLSSPIEDTAYCLAPGCSNYNQRMCNEAQRPSKFGHRQMVNGILRFKTTSSGKPLLSVRTLSPSVIPFGTEGRLIYSDITKIIYLYLRSTSWHALPLTGLLVLGPPTSISWVTQEAVSRPGEYPCGASNRCPKDCVTGVYTDLFPLGARFEYAATVFLNAETYRVNPTLALINRTNIISKKKITTESQKAGYTTTTCFVFKLRVWCVSVVELTPATMTAYEPIPFLYQLDLVCRGNNGTVAMQFSGQEGVYKVGRFKSPRNECFFEKVREKYYFVVSTPEGIQPYEIRDLKPDHMPHIIMYISDVCAPALSAFKKLLPAMRPITTLTVGNWQFRPVDVRGGLRVDIYRNTTKSGDQTLAAPEDPGSNTFPGDHTESEGVKQVGHYTIDYTDLQSIGQKDQANAVTQLPHIVNAHVTTGPQLAEGETIVHPVKTHNPNLQATPESPYEGFSGDNMIPVVEGDDKYVTEKPVLSYSDIQPSSPEVIVITSKDQSSKSGNAGTTTIVSKHDRTEPDGLIEGTTLSSRVTEPLAPTNGSATPVPERQVPPARSTTKSEDTTYAATTMLTLSTKPSIHLRTSFRPNNPEEPAPEDQNTPAIPTMITDEPEEEDNQTKEVISDKGTTKMTEKSSDPLHGQSTTTAPLITSSAAFATSTKQHELTIAENVTGSLDHVNGTLNPQAGRERTVRSILGDVVNQVWSFVRGTTP
uniref:Attachment glycoprotein n=1 Tax=Paramyxoviridae sp. TaxID=1663356 RepID=A0A858HS51_9MONO|nr:attachment glycoprotein [Paramyxoviridae sp.]